MHHKNPQKPKLTSLQSLLYGLYKYAKKTGLMESVFMQRLASFVYDKIRPKGEIKVELALGTLVLKPADRTMTPLLIAGESYEEDEVGLCQQLIKPGMTVIDIGANIGYFTLLFAKLVGNHGHVIAIEPEPDNFLYLQQNVTINRCQNVKLLPVALADRVGTMDLWVGKTSQTTASFIKENVLYEDQINRVVVATQTLDKILQDMAITQVDFIKLDIQGFEEVALRGAEQLLQRTHAAIIMELWPYGIQKSGRSIDSLLSLITQYQYECYRLIDGAKGELKPCHWAELLSLSSQDARFYFNLVFLKKPAAAP